MHSFGLFRRDHRRRLFLTVAACCLVRLGAAAAEATPEVIRSAAAVRALTPQEAAQARPVVLEGVVINVSPRWPAIVLRVQDEGIYIRMPGSTPSGLKLGDWVEITGTTEPGNFAPIAAAKSIRRLGRRPLPPPLRTTIAEIAAGGFDADWVEIEGIVRSCTIDPGTREGPDEEESEPAVATAGVASAAEVSNLTLAWGTARLRVRVPGRLAASELVDAHVRLRGVCFSIHNANRQFVRASIQAADATYITVLTPPPPNPFSLPVQRAAELLQFRPEGFSGHRVHVQGVVTRHTAGQTLWIRDGKRGLRVETSQRDRFAPGDWVEIAGFIDPGSYSPALVDAVVQRTRVGTPPAPIPISQLPDAVAHDADLIQIEAGLSDLRRVPEGFLLSLDLEGKTVEALLVAREPGPPPPAWGVGSVLRASGICVLAPWGPAPEGGLWGAQSFRLLLQDPADVVVVRAAPWLTAKKALLLLGTGAAALLLTVIWLVVVSRRQIAQREGARKMAEAEFAAILRERNRMARDIHDTLAQGLNAVSVQLELAKNARDRSPDGGHSHLVTAHKIVRSCIAEARESIWNMRSQVLERTDLVGALDGVLRQLSEGLPIETKVETIGPCRRLAPAVENNLLRIGQEAVSNAVKHARASRLTLRVEFEPATVRLVITDNGVGFDPSAATRVTSRFGLAGMRERVEQMHATLEIRSTPGQGTEVAVTVLPPQ